MTKKAVVTGGAGFIGPHIARELLHRGYEVHVIDNLSTGKQSNVPEGVVFHEVSIVDTKAITEIMQGAEGVFHTAALPRVPFSVEYPLESNEANITGTLSVLVAARDAKVKRVVYSASSSAYGNQTVLPLLETMTPNPMSPYGLQKYTGELYMKIFAEVYRLETVCLRYFNVYGSGMDPDGPAALAIPRFIAQHKRGEALTLTGDGTKTRDYTHVRDVVSANMLALESVHVGKGEVLNIGAGHNISVLELADLIDGGEAVGAKRIFIPARAEAQDSRADFSKARELLGWEPTVQIKDGIAELMRA
jgi:UDP-glucose 4-epimerase